MECKKKLVVLTQQSLTEQNFERQGIDKLSNYFDIYIFNISLFTLRNYEFSKNEILFKNNFHLQSENEFISKIKKIKPAYLINFIGLNKNTKSIIKAIKKDNIKYIYQSGGPLYHPNIFIRIIYRINQSFEVKKLGLINELKKSDIDTKVDLKINTFFQNILLILEKIREDFYYKVLIFSFPKPDISLLSGKLALNNYTKRSQKILWVSSPDYYKLKNSKLHNNYNDKYILFIDDIIASTNDFEIFMHQNKPIEENEYYRLLNNTFDKIEKLFNLKVIIAAHPQGKLINSYEKKFKGRKVLFNQTENLTKFSTLVITHFSTAIGYAILSSKPILLLTSLSISKHNYGMKIKYLSKKINVKLIYMESIDSFTNKKQLVNINLSKYKNYIYDLIRNKSCKETNTWNELIRHLSNEY